MTTRVLDAEAVIRARDATGGVFSSVAAKIRRMVTAARSASRLGDAAERGVARSERAAAAANRMVALPAARYLAPAAAAAAAISATKRFADAEMRLTRIGITANATDAEIAALHKTIRDLAFESAKPFDEVAEGLDALVTGGLDLKEALPSLGAIIKTAQAAGAEIKDISNSSLSLSQSLGIQANKMQAAFDILVAGGKAGKFELKDMARYLPSIAPAAAAVGMKGEEGLKRIVSLLQVVRAGTGTAEEAAASVQNIFAKMESEATAEKFTKFGVDLRKEMASARKQGKDLLEVFMELTDKATKGDQSKIPQLFTDMEFARGMRAIASYRDLMKSVRGELDKAAGSSMVDFERVMKRQKAHIDQFSESYDRAKDSLGKFLVAAGAGKTLDKVTDLLQGQIAEAEKTPQQRERDDTERNRALNRKIAIERDKNLLKAEEGRGTLFGGPDLETIQTIKKRIARNTVELQLSENWLLAGHNRPMPDIYSPEELKRWREEFAPDQYRRHEYPGGKPMPMADPRKAAQGVPAPAMLDLADTVRSAVRSAVDEKSSSNIGAEIGNLLAKLDARPVKADLEGRADIKVGVDVRAGDGLKAEIKSLVSQAVGHVAVNGGSVASGSTGSTGRSMPESQSKM